MLSKGGRVGTTAEVGLQVGDSSEQNDQESQEERVGCADVEVQTADLLREEEREKSGRSTFANGVEMMTSAPSNFTVAKVDRCEQTGDSLLGAEGSKSTALEPPKSRESAEMPECSEAMRNEDKAAEEEEEEERLEEGGNNNSGIESARRFSSNTSGDVPSLTDFEGGDELMGCEKEAEEVEKQEIDDSQESRESSSSSSTLKNSYRVQDEEYDEEEESSSLPTEDTFKILLDCLVREERFPEGAEALDKVARAEGLQGRLGRELARSGRLVGVLDAMARFNFEAPLFPDDNADFSDRAGGGENSSEGSSDYGGNLRLGSHELQLRVLSRLRSSTAATEKHSNLRAADNAKKLNDAEKLAMFEATRLSVMRDLESASVSNLDLPFTDLCTRKRTAAAAETKRPDLRRRRRRAARQRQPQEREPLPATNEDLGGRRDAAADRRLVASFGRDASQIRPLRAPGAGVGGGGGGCDVIKVPLLEDIQERSSQEQEDSEEAAASYARSRRHSAMAAAASKHFF